MRIHAALVLTLASAALGTGLRAQEPAPTTPPRIQRVVPLPAADPARMREPRIVCGLTLVPGDASIDPEIALPPAPAPLAPPPMSWQMPVPRLAPQPPVAPAPPPPQIAPPPPPQIAPPAPQVAPPVAPRAPAPAPRALPVKPTIRAVQPSICWP